MERNQIYTIEGTNYVRMTLELLNACGLADDIGSREKRIGLKPNLVAASPASQGATTHPEIVEGCLTYLKEKGFENVVVLEGSWVGASTGEAVRVNGIWDVCLRHKVPFLDLQKDESVSCKAGEMDIKVCRQALEVDYLINLPVIKGHCQTGMTCALKNAKGLLPASEKRRFHAMGLHRPIAYLNTVIHQDFILADNICGDLDFEEGGNPVTMNRILAFKDPVLCDSFAARTMGYDPEEIEYIRLAEKLGVGSTDLSSAQICDLSQDKKTEGGRGKGTLAPRGRVRQLAGFVNQNHACSACYGSLIYALDRLDEEGILRGKKKESIAIGQGFRGKSGELGVGSCTSCFRHSLKGCPPAAADMARFLKENWKN